MAIPFDPDEIIRTLGTELITDVNLVAGTFLETVVPLTPVDTGHARRNWQVNLSAPNGQELPGVDVSGRPTISTGKAKLEGSKRRNPFTKVYVENNVPYIGRLNDGSSRQAPAMFVEGAIARAIREGPQRKEI